MDVYVEHEWRVVHISEIKHAAGVVAIMLRWLYRGTNVKVPMCFYSILSKPIDGWKASSALYLYSPCPVLIMRRINEAGFYTTFGLFPMGECLPVPRSQYTCPTEGLDRIVCEFFSARLTAREAVTLARLQISSSTRSW